MKIKKIVKELVDVYQTRDPFEIAEKMGILVTKDVLGYIQGYYILYSGIKCICINNQISDFNNQKIIMAHELGHSVMHEQERFMFYPNTLFSIDKTEIEANRFAAELLISDDEIMKYPGVSKNKISKMLGYNEKLIDYKKI